MLPMRFSGSETRLTLWALSAAEAFSELRADLCSQSHTIVLVLDAESARLSEQLQQLKRLLQSAQLHLQPGQNPALFLVAAVSARIQSCFMLARLTRSGFPYTAFINNTVYPRNAPQHPLLNPCNGFKLRQCQHLRMRCVLHRREGRGAFGLKRQQSAGGLQQSITAVSLKCNR